MKKTLFILLAGLTAYNANSQEQVSTRLATPANVSNQASTDGISRHNAAGKGTGLSDTLYFASNAQLTSSTYANYNYDFAAPSDSGKLYGTNVVGSKGYAQLYRYSSIDNTTPADTTYNILGVVSRFFGTVQTGSNKNVVLNVWKRDANKYAVAGRSKFYIYGVPLSTSQASKTVPFTGLTLGGYTMSYFSAPLTGVNYDVYVGYTVAYTWAGLAGDTIGLSATTTAGTNSYALETGTNDTLVSARNLSQLSSGTWKSTLFDLNINGGDQIIFPIIQLSCTACHPTSINGVTRNNLTFFGNYPSPAVNSTNIRFALKNKADVTITVVDMAGRTVNTINKNSLTPGEHTVNVETAQLPSGNYVYMIQTSEGDGLASQFTVAK